MFKEAMGLYISLDVKNKYLLISDYWLFSLTMGKLIYFLRLF